ncbi:MAG: glutaminyl-tRNA synthase (glutamine-hydrolyzing) subunit B [Candidatus Niyogibacteria bacterium RIFCSPLOWO2_12_FULL_41_13]|uniref:Aspartyl/glutamyl-tRNA(Asn/Gln) amidotransferase subunit B n=1 Tax=Candidatus Niyogibacteria bacterium RIFCSPLOWO2_12_FULL_41_13 TaxID=1801726 RepID=A0A1G2F1J8_9BACT|nr:MAG: glutaminyl-tRNA synthase (glutamine-hydrolyzing) subunit B [Candidatus Niyogibacteria bacterium RIFCSPLOWO2_12_FULL_41_13]
MTYKPTIGLEIHLELNTRSKMFCDSPNEPEERHPNLNVCPVCMAHPGTLPTINKEAIKKVLKLGLLLGGEIAKHSYFERKNYFYPDLPKGYQISQYHSPLVKNASLNLKSGKKIKIQRIHLEEDTGRLIHSGKETLVDFNRAGIPLMELVTEPDFESSQEAKEFAEELRTIVKTLNISSADMEKGVMRVEANISLSQNAKLGTKVEIKNLNSFKAVERAIEYEVERQTEILASGKKIVQETRGWDDIEEKTVSQRIKEESHDYRYFPEPDLPALNLEKDEEFNIEKLRAELPETPEQKRKRLKNQYNLEEELIEILVKDPQILSFFENAVSELMEWAKPEDKKNLTTLASNYLKTDLLGLANEKQISFSELLLTPENFAELIKMLVKNEITSRGAKDVLRKIIEQGGDPSQIVEELGLKQITDEDYLETVVKEVIRDNQKPAEDYKKGKQEALQFLIGQTMKQTRGKAKPEVARKLLEKFLKS